MKICLENECQFFSDGEPNNCKMEINVLQCGEKPLTTETEPVANVLCSDGLSCQDEIVEQLIKLAADMATRQGFPSEYVEDWPISKHTPQKTLNEIERNMEIIQKKMAGWSYRVRQLANELHKAR